MVETGLACSAVYDDSLFLHLMLGQMSAAPSPKASLKNRLRTLMDKLLVAGGNLHAGYPADSDSHVFVCTSKSTIYTSIHSLSGACKHVGGSSMPHYWPNSCYGGAQAGYLAAIVAKV